MSDQEEEVVEPASSPRCLLCGVDCGCRVEDSHPSAVDLYAWPVLLEPAPRFEVSSVTTRRRSSLC